MEEMVWISEPFVPDPNEALACDLQNFLSSDLPTVSQYSSYAALRRWNPLAPASARVSKKSKRKPREGEAKLPLTTYIRADPANFREMVQRVTGLIDLETSSDSPSPAPMTSEAAPPPQLLLPTLDTSSLLLNQFAGDALGLPPVSHFAYPLLPVLPTTPLEPWGVMYR
ncbi:calmodulin-binding protein 25-like [Zingiber officinale]|uniref:VQ domain-containing protein n=1 Tax=Zingiber officinale TaxID=94328 RepID=A0A8J5EV64_ZINOF|nr:calmodulin-binding protein 25-like [Zingiber officinale]KAG6472114.1 hypothetical protein ZIOFF_069571 [Zingiber officinale]